MTTFPTGQYLPRLDHSLTGDDERPHLGAVLLKSKLLRPEQLDEALRQQTGTGRRLGEILIDRGWLFPQDIARALAAQFDFEYVDIHHVSVDPRAARRLDPEVGERCSAIPVRMLTDGTVLVAVADPTSETLAEVQHAIDAPVAFAVTEVDDIKRAWRRLMQGYRP
jgi:type IV pilus assembly protein PilB